MTSKNSEKETKPQEPAAIKLTPAEWARAGQVKRGSMAQNLEGQIKKKHVEDPTIHGVQLREGESLSAAFACADAIFGWSLQAHHYGADSFRLTEDDFRRALETACKFPCATPHPPAVPPHSQDKFKGFKPKKSS